jgi:hypothetical protein
LHQALKVLRGAPAADTAVPRRREREAELLVRLCHLDVREGQYDAAEEHLQRAIVLAGEPPDPDLAERIRHHRAELFVLRGDFDAAERCFFPPSSAEGSA